MARDFDGATDRIDYVKPLVATAQAQTFSCWCWIDNTTHSQYIFTMHRTAGATWAFIFYSGWIDPNWNIQVLVRFDGAQSLQRTSNNDPFTLGAWHHMLYTWDGSSTGANAHIYIDGSEVGYAVTNNGDGSAYACDSAWSLGGRKEDDARNTDGRLAATGWWNRVLAAGEIASLAAGYSPLFIPNGLKFAPDLIRHQRDVISGETGTLDGTTVVAHPRVILPYKPL